MSFLLGLIWFSIGAVFVLLVASMVSTAYHHGIDEGRKHAGDSDDEEVK